MNFSINYNFKIYTEYDVKVIETKYGKYYINAFDEGALFKAIVFMNANMLQEIAGKGR